MIFAIQTLICEMSETMIYAIAAVVAVFVGAFAGVGMAIATSKAIDAIARQPEADSKIRSSMVLGIVFIETTIIYALIIGIMLVIQLF